MSDGGPASPSEDPAKTHAPHGWEVQPWVWFAAFVAAMALLIGGGFLLPRYQRHKMGEELLALKPDETPKHAELYAFAIKVGEPVYGKHCASCHGADLHGDPQRGVPRLSDADWLYGGGLMSDLEKTISYGIRSGHPKAWNLAVMPAFASSAPHSVEIANALPHLTDPEIDDLTAFTLALAHKPADPVAAKRGEALFNDKGGCFDCHGADGGGDSAIGAPNLTDAIWLYGNGDPASIRTSIAEGRQGDCPAWIDALGALKVRGLAAYIKSRSKQSPYAVLPEDLAK